MNQSRTTRCSSRSSTRFSSTVARSIRCTGYSADGAYGRNGLFNAPEQRGIASGIKTRADAATHSAGSSYRAECVRDRNRWGGYQMWSLVTTYGMRGKVEGFFSTIKRIVGEGVQATSQEGMVRGIRMKVNCYNMLIALAP